eukprot:CAMPEP_0201547082 /NCGR_PEP_ID=MMETSP0173_2-20130828/3483_1 /ASSEMBLY_ACC=CAM_ASM_000268 /TAXON_ID=218659 /ORGANISM="Vexillifera sp., Strain DIVA3 564/2" /LENGTH=521 /DNA_ID=CAMNT_0047955995 /DNA_START=53 /DNA_END=1618 /DNA_ORIENTATION=+
MTSNLNGDGIFQKILNEIDKVIVIESEYANNALKLKTQLCFAVKPGIDGLLDVSRKTYSEGIEDLHTHKMHFEETFQLKSLKLHYNQKRGWFFSTLKTEPPPAQYVIEKSSYGKKGGFAFSTNILSSISERIRQSEIEIFLLTDALIVKVVEFIQASLAPIHKCSETIALLDMLYAFATFVTLSCPKQTSTDVSAPHYPFPVVRPQFCERKTSNTLAMHQLYHPIVACALNNNKPMVDEGEVDGYVPNNVYLSQACTTLLLTGANNSGKSTLCSSVCLALILAHVGCFVPADFCMLPLFDMISVKMSEDDSIESNSSSFFREMQQVSYITNTLKDNQAHRAFVVLDEMAKCTTTIEGHGLLWATCESLLAAKRQQYAMVTTHWHEIGQRLSSLYPTRIRSMEMAATIDEKDGKVNPTFQMRHGVCQMKTYGIQSALAAGFPFEIVQSALDLRKMLSTTTTDNISVSSSTTDNISASSSTTTDNISASSWTVHIANNILDILSNTLLTSDDLKALKSLKDKL